MTSQIYPISPPPPSGSVSPPVPRLEIGTEVIAFNDATVLTLTPPTGAVVAELQVQDGDIQFRFAVSPISDGIWIPNGHPAELESADEIQKFQFIGKTGNSGKVIVHYFNGVREDVNA